MPGNNFITNPGGSGSRGTGRRFDNQKSEPQRPREATADRDQATAAPGGLVPLADGKPSPGKDIGVGSVGNGQKPYTLNG